MYRLADLFFRPRVAGIVFAAVLSHHFEKVVVVEPDYVPILEKAAPGGSAENPRTRVRQYRQVCSHNVSWFDLHFSQTLNLSPCFF